MKLVMKKAYSEEKIAMAMGVHRTTITRRAAKEEWVAAYKKTQGGRKGFLKVFITGLLPEDVRFCLMVHEGLAEEGDDPKLATARLEGVLLDEHDEPKGVKYLLTDAQKKTALAKVDLVNLYNAHVTKSTWGGKDKAKADFLFLYHLQEWPHLYSILGKVSLQTIERWKKTLDTKGDAFALADRRGSHKLGKHNLTAEQGQILTSMALNPNRPKISYVIRMAQSIMDRRGINHPSPAICRRYLKEYKAKHYDTWVFAREGEKGLNDKVAYNIKRDYSKIAVGDVLVADGHTLNFDIINPWTGKPKRMALILFYDMKSSMGLGWEIMPTENTSAINSALRRSIITLGKIPKCVYLDNGRAFKAKFFTNSPDFDEAGLTGLYARLGIETTFAWPYHGQSKTVERFFGTLHEAEVWMPTYVGNSIDRKPPRMNRGEKLHMALWEKATSGLSLTMEQAHQLIAAFLDEYSQREQGADSHLAGKRPIDVFMEGRGPGVDREELRELMMETTIKHISQDGIKLLGEYYYHPAIYGLRHPVLVKYDLLDRSSVLIYDENGFFLCEAAPRPGVHPMAKLGTDEDRQLLTKEIELKKSLIAQTIGPARELLKNEIMPDYIRQLESKGVAPINQGSSIRQAGGKPKELSRAEIRRIDTEYRKRARENKEFQAQQNQGQIEEKYVPTVVSATAMLWEDVERLDNEQRYEKLIELSVKGQLIPRKWQTWMDFFEQTPCYEKQLDYWEEYRAKMAFVWQVESSVK